MAVKPPDFAAGIDRSKFAVAGAAADEAKGKGIQGDTNAISNDWSKVNEGLDKLGPMQDYFQKASMGGEGATAAGKTARGQENLAESTHSPASLAKAFSKIAQGGAGQADEVGRAGAAQAQQMQDQAQQISQFKTQTRLQQIGSDTTLKNAQFAIGEKITQATNGLQLAQQQLKSMLNHALSSAKNSKDLADLQAQHADLNTLFSYIQMGLGGGAAITASLADAASQSNQLTGVEEKAHDAQQQQSSDILRKSKENGIG